MNTRAVTPIHATPLRAIRHVRFAFLAAALWGAAVPWGSSASEGSKGSFFAYRSFWPEFSAMRQFKEAGVNTVCIFPANTANSLGQPYCKYPPVWRWFGKYDLDSLNKQFDDVLAVNPGAGYICMIDLNTPLWLQRQLALGGHSAECESFTMLSCACANPAWRKATGEYLEAVVKHMEARYGDRVRAYLPACGQTDEWMDYSRGAAGRTKTQAWRAWLQAHGKAEVPVPALERLDRASFDDLIRDPATEQDVVDYAQFTGDLVADTVLEFAAKTRALIPKHRQIGMFFGYILELTNSRLVWAGHLEYEQLYRSPYIDFFVSPGTYGDRPMGGGSGFMVPNGTRRLHNKGFLHEIDHRTPTYNVKLDEFVSIGWMVPWKDQAQTNAGLKREFALAIINQASLWCFDMWGGVFQTPETMRLVEQSKKLWDQYGATPLKSRAEVALVVDPHSARYLNDLHPAIPRSSAGGSAAVPADGFSRAVCGHTGEVGGAQAARVPGQSDGVVRLRARHLRREEPGSGAGESSDRQRVQDARYQNGAAGWLDRGLRAAIRRPYSAGLAASGGRGGRDDRLPGRGAGIRQRASAGDPYGARR